MRSPSHCKTPVAALRLRQRRRLIHDDDDDDDEDSRCSKALRTEAPTKHEHVQRIADSTGRKVHQYARMTSDSLARAAFTGAREHKAKLHKHASSLQHMHQVKLCLDSLVARPCLGGLAAIVPL